MTPDELAAYTEHSVEHQVGYFGTIVFCFILVGFYVAAYELLTHWTDAILKRIAERRTTGR